MTYDSEGIYVDTLSAGSGCDSIIVLQVNIVKSFVEVNETICVGDSIEWLGAFYDSTGVYTDTTFYENGCTSVSQLNLLVVEEFRDTTQATICEGEVFEWNGMTYDSAGTYTDTLSSEQGCDSILVLNLFVTDTINSQDSAGPDLTLTCHQPSQEIGPTDPLQGATYNWSGPGISPSNRNIPSPVIDRPGTYILEITTAGGCSVQDTVLVTQDESILNASAGPDKEITCESGTVILEGQSSVENVIYQWSGPGITMDNENDQFPEVSEPGRYTLTVIEATNGCRSNEAEVQVIDNQNIPVVLIKEIGALNCYTASVTLDASASSTGDRYRIKWITPSGTAIDSLMKIEVSESGLYTLTIIDTITGCSASDNMMVEDFMNYPTADAGQPKELHCGDGIVVLNGDSSSRGPNITYSWEGPEGGVLDDASLINVSVQKPGKYILTVVDTTNGCANTDSVLVSEKFQTLQAILPESVALDCFDGKAYLDGSLSSSGENITYQWEVLSGRLTGGFENMMARSDREGSYVLRVIDSESGCEARDTIRVISPDLPSGAEVDTQPSCLGGNNGSISVNNITGGESPYLLSLNGAPFSGRATYQPLAPGDYNLTIQDAKGCEWQTTVAVQERPSINIQLDPEIRIRRGETTQLDVQVNIPSQEISKINWTPADSLSCSDCLTPTANPSETATYRVYVEDIFGCNGEEPVTIFVNPLQEIYVPNIFSPNGDDINDRFVIYAGPEIKKVKELKIFSRWGELVFEIYDFLPNDVNFGWDGNFQGEPMNAAVFAWFTIVETTDGREIILKGDLTLVR
jgi:gliding motility-associated-like protein